MGLTAAVQALTAVAIGVLTKRLVDATKDYVTKTQAIVDENHRMSTATTSALFLETLPILALTSREYNSKLGWVGAWKNVGEGSAINIELAMEPHGGGKMIPNDLGQSVLEHDRFVALRPGDELRFVARRGEPLVTWLAKYDDIQGNTYLSAQQTWDNASLCVSRYRDPWEEGQPLTDILRQLGYPEATKDRLPSGRLLPS